MKIQEAVLLLVVFLWNICFSISGAKQKTRENLKEMCDVQSGMASAIIQMYLKEVCCAFRFDFDLQQAIQEMEMMNSSVIFMTSCL